MDANASLIPSANDLLMVIPRLARLAVYRLPEQMDTVINKIRNGGSVIAEATSTDTITSSVTEMSNATLQTSPAAIEAASTASQRGVFAWLINAFNFEGARGFGGMFSYFSSRWALATFAIVR